MADILQFTFPNVFYSQKMVEFQQKISQKFDANDPIDSK